MEGEDWGTGWERGEGEIATRTGLEKGETQAGWTKDEVSSLWRGLDSICFHLVG